LTIAATNETLTPFIHDAFGFPAQTDLRLNRRAAQGCACVAYLVTVECTARVNAVHFADEDHAMIGRIKRTGVAAAVSLAIAMLAPAALAQTQPAPQQAPPQGNAAAPQAANTGPAPNDTELKNFADAALDVQGIKQSMQPQIASAPTADARTKLQAQAEKKMEAAVESHRLSPKRYMQIATLAQTDSNVRVKVQNLMSPPPPPSKP